MKTDEFFQRVKEHFRYLVDDYAFSVIKEESYPSVAGGAVHWQSRDCRIAVVLERGDVFVEIGGQSGPEAFELGIIIAFLTPTSTPRDWLVFSPILDRHLDYDVRINEQVRWLSDKLRLYMDKIIQLCRDNVFAHKRQVLEEMMWKRHEEIMKNMQERRTSQSGDGEL
jgi:hypothetical protein